MQFSAYSKDSLRVKNKVTVYGLQNQPYPLQKDGRAYSDTWTDLAIPYNKSELSLDAAASQAVIRIPSGDGAQFSVDDYLWLEDASVNRGEILQVESISAGSGPGGEDEITFTSNLVNAYTTANHTIVFEVSPSGGWGYRPYTDNDSSTITADSNTKVTGYYSIKETMNTNETAFRIIKPLISTEHFSMDEYPEFHVLFYFVSEVPEYVHIYLLSDDQTGSKWARTESVVINQPDEWVEISLKGGADYPDQWQTKGADFSWTDISGIEIHVSYGSNGAKRSIYIDKMYFAGKRWGGGSSHAASDGYAEDGSSQSTYGTKEIVLIEDLLRSNADCEAKARSLLNYYKDEQISLELSSDTLDWENYHPTPGNKIAADLDLVGVTGSEYRIDSIDIRFRAADNTLSVLYTLDKSPSRLADYLFNMAREIREIRRDYKTIR